MLDNAEELMRLAAPRISYDMHAEAQLARITASATHSPHRSPATGPRSRAGAALAAFVLAVITISITTVNSQPASATTPPLLQPQPVSGNTGTALKQYASLRRVAEDSYERLVVHTWSTGTLVDPKGATISQSVEPSVRTIIFEPNGSERHTTVAGQPFPGQDHAGLREPGTVLLDEHLSPEETLAGVLREPIPTDASNVATWLERTLNIDPKDANAVIRQTTGVLISTNVVPAQEGALLDYLADIPGLQLLGTVQDRNGREGVAFATEPDSDSNYQVLIVSPDSGEMVGTETVHAPATRSDGTVTYYASWIRR